MGATLTRDVVSRIKEALISRTELVRAVLPDHLKGEAERYVQRALLYFIRRAELHECSDASFVQCAVDSAEIGIPLDGRLGHAVAYNTKVSKRGEPDRWEKKAQFIPDWKGLLSVAKRTNQIADGRGDVVCENDQFECGRDGDKCYLRHSPHLTQRGEVIGAYVVITTHNGPWSYEYMTIEQLDHVRCKSKAKDSGPWVTDFAEMCRKTVVKRALKYYCDDPTLIRAIEMDERDEEYERFEPSRQQRAALSKTDPFKLAHEPAQTLDIPATTAETEPAERPRTATKQQAAKQSVEASPIDTIRLEIAKCKTIGQLDGLRDELNQDPSLSDWRDEIDTAMKEAHARLQAK